MSLLTRTFTIRASRPPSLRERLEAAELLDLPGQDEQALTGNLRDIRRVNRLFGGISAVLKRLPSLLDAIPPGETVTILDLATGSADIPLAIARWARITGRRVRLCASDLSPEILQVARAMTTLDGGISFERYDARSVPLPDRSFDIVLCSLALHHFPPHEAVKVIGEMDRLAIHGFIVNDLRRSTFAFLATWLATRVATRNPLTRHDAPLSIRRAYTPGELRNLLDKAGVTGATIESTRWFRMVAIRQRAA